MALTDTLIRNTKPAEKQFKLADSKGMFLLIMPSGAKYWRLKYYHMKKEKILALGVYPEVTLKEAREKCEQARKIVQSGKDPVQAKEEEKRQALIAEAHSFEVVAREWHENKKEKWSEKHAKGIMRRLELDAFPHIGHRPITAITASELLSVIRLIEKRDALDISHQVLQLCGQVFRYAIATSRGERDISADLRGALKTRKQEHYAYLKENEMPTFLKQLAGYDGDKLTKLAWEFMLFTFVRTRELRGAEWKEIDFEKAEWRIPAERMKMQELHIVPLSRQALIVLEKLKCVSGNRKYIFPNRTKANTVISENTLLYALYRMGYHSRATTHGFRATASTILNEHGFHPDVIERQLAHTERNKVRASYNHAQYLPERREMMQWWADYLDRAKAA